MATDSAVGSAVDWVAKAESVVGFVADSAVDAAADSVAVGGSVARAAGLVTETIAALAASTGHRIIKRKTRIHSSP
jgi:hypothetical protein